MNFNIKTQEEIKIMREGGQILAFILHTLATSAKIGMRTEELNLMAETLMAEKNVIPSFKGYKGYPAVICTSVNNEVVHSIPGKTTLRDGDIISIDCGIIHKGFHTDSAVTIMVGNVKPDVRKFVITVQQALEKGIDVVRPGIHVGDIGFAIQQWIESHGYSVIKDFVGHGIGKNLHEPPEIPNFGKKGKGQILVPGMTLAIEPIIAKGERFVDTKSDRWTAITRDGEVACQIEHTITVTPSGYDVLTTYNNNIKNIYPQ